MSPQVDITKPVLVLGATGKTGRRIAERLESRGVPVRRGSRAAQPPFDWEDRATWPAALHGASAVYISYYPDLAFAGATEAVGGAARVVHPHLAQGATDGTPENGIGQGPEIAGVSRHGDRKGSARHGDGGGRRCRHRGCCDAEREHGSKMATGIRRVRLILMVFLSPR